MCKNKLAENQVLKWRKTTCSCATSFRGYQSFEAKNMQLGGSRESSTP